MARPIRVLVQNGEYWLANKGDLAILEVGLGRLRRHWPDARIGVLTAAPWLLRSIAPSAEPVPAHGPAGWPARPRSAVRLDARLVGPLDTARLRAREQSRVWRHRIASRIPAIGVPAGPRAGDWVPQALEGSSLVLAFGGGYMTDVDPDQTTRTLALLERAADRGIPTAMLGQGLGPLEDAHLVERARAVLPTVALFGLREPLLGPRLLGDLGVDAERVAVTGDDAVVLGLEEARDDWGSGLGICLRFAPYSPVSELASTAVRAAVRSEAGRLAAPLVPLFVSEYHREDRRATLPIVEGYPDVVRPLGPYAGARPVVRQVSRCRVVVTAAYHLAVFALSQGIPVVGLTSSPYYDAKFAGLSAVFGGVGLTVASLEDADLRSRLAELVAEAWRSAPEVRAHLRDRARAQVRASEEAYRRVFALVDRPVGTG
ncbi:polysaccharide pyruvyl transferase family protein [Geodermatophilus sp. SYSU D00867]